MKRTTQKTAEATDNLIGNETTDKITNSSRTSPQNSSGAVTSETKYTEFDRETPKERYISPERRKL